VAFRDVLANAVGELYLRFRVPFNEGEWIKIGDIEGRVVSIRTFDVELVTLKGDRIVIPNSYFLRSFLVKRSGMAGGVSEFSLSIRGAPLREVEKILDEALEKVRPELAARGEIRSLKRDRNMVRITVALPLLNLLKAEKVMDEFVESIRARGYEVEVL
jgi:small-conductance mechanosensitive channel